MPMLNYSLRAVEENAQKAIQSNNVIIMGRLLGQVRAMGQGLAEVDRRHARQLSILLSKKLRSLEKKPRVKKVADVSSAPAG